MSYSVDNIIKLNLILTPAGLGFANFSSVFIFARDTEGSLDEYFATDTYRDYTSLSEVAEDFDTTTEAYRMASRWFANVPKPPKATIWLWNDVTDSAEDVANKADNEAWRFWYFFDSTVFQDVPATLSLATWADANEHMIPVVSSDAAIVDPQDDTDIMSQLQGAGNRFVFGSYRSVDVVTSDPSQIYAGMQLAAAFNKFNPEGFRTAITGEYQVLPGVAGDDLTTTEYGALVDKNTTFFSPVELKGSVDNSRVINSKSMSSFGEFIDDVVNLAVLENRMQVNAYDYITGTGTKRPLTPRGYAGLLDALSRTCKQFYDNGVLGQSDYVDPSDGETKVAKYGYVVFGNPEDVFDLSSAEELARQFPETSILAILARAGHTASITVNVE